MRIAQVTDLHLDDFMAKDGDVDSRKNLVTILDAIKEEGISELMVTGDLGIPDSHPWLLDMITKRSLRPFFVLGNHDTLADFQYRLEIPELMKPDGLYYTSVIADVFCFFLDSSQGKIKGEQYSWLEELLTSDIQSAVIFTHHPILDCGGTAMDRLYPLENRERLFELFRESNKQISIFCGHYHTIHEQSTGNISQYVTPSALLQLKRQSDKIDLESKDFGFRLIDLSKDAIHTDVVLFSE